MKKTISTLVCLTLFGITASLGQSDKRYVTTGGEWIFSFGGTEESNIVRFSPVFNLQSYVHNDVSEHFGIIYGLSLRNVGFIYDEPGKAVRKKFRTYNVGVPVGFKLGDLERRFLYAGYEVEFPFNYKEKTFQNEKKEDKFNVWFSDRTESVAHGFFVGFQLNSGMNIKFKYYLNNFHNMDFVETVDGQEVKPYENMENNVFYFSLNYSLFRGKKFIYTENTGVFL